MHQSPAASSAAVPSFFWKRPVESRGRFNLLLLEYGELFFEDLAVFYYPVFPNHSTSFAQCDAVKWKGRLKLCSRSLIFEPNDERKPLYKFAFKAIDSVVEPFHLRREEADECRSSTGKLPSGFLTFTCTNYAEMKENNHVGPYRTVDNGGISTRFLFAVVHADMPTLLSKITNLRKGGGDGGGGETGTIVTRPLATGSLFNSSHLVDFHETLQFKEPISASRVSPLLLHPGSLMVTDKRIYFQPSQLNNVGDAVVCFDISRISLVYARRHLLRQRGLEIFFRHHGSSSSSVEQAGMNGQARSSSYDNDTTGAAYFVFDSEEVRDQVLHTIATQPSYPLQSAGTSSRVSIVEDMFRKWQLGQVSNFDYLMFLNYEADRSLSDLAQYPVFPHVIVDYTSAVLDLTSPSVYRDLSKPVGALNPQRLAFFKERFEAMVMSSTKTTPPSTSSHNNNSSSSKNQSKNSQPDGGSNSIPPPFLYGTHYSTPGYVLYFLVRVAPEHMLCLSDGKFDAADRMFHSLPAMLDSCLNNPADLKELIPEFFYGDGDFLLNSSGLDLGRRQNGSGERIGDVELPAWADGSPAEFIAQNRRALESEYVSAHLHEWIDLIFGYKQRGVEALNADNLFYHLTYDHNDGHEISAGAGNSTTISTSSSGSTTMSLDTKQSQLEREARDVQVAEFGQIPKQLFAGPHPSRTDQTCSALDFAAGISKKQKASALRPETDNNHHNNSSSNSNGPRPAALTTMPPPLTEPSDSTVVKSSSSSSENRDGGRGTDSLLEASAGTPTSSSSSSSTAMNSTTHGPTATTAASPLGMVGVMELGDDFRAEVEQQILLMSPQSTGASSSSQGSRLVVNMHARRDNGTHLEPTTSFPSEDLTAVPPVTATVPPSSSSAASSLKNRMWGLVADTANVVAEQVDKHKDRFPLQQFASRWQQPWLSSNKEATAAAGRAAGDATSDSQHPSDPPRPGQELGLDASGAQPGHDNIRGHGKGDTQQQRPKATVTFHALAATESNTLCKLKAAVTGVSAVRVVSTMTTAGGRREKRGVDKVVVGACAKDLSTMIVDCSHRRAGSPAAPAHAAAPAAVVRLSFVAHAGMSGGSGSGMETSLAQQMVSRVGSSLPLFLGNVVTAPFLAAAAGVGGSSGGVTAAGATSSSSSCRLSVDGEHVLVSAVKGLECSLYSYLLQPKGSATLEGHNVVSYDDNVDDGPGTGPRKPRPPPSAAAAAAKPLFGPCVALGRGTQLLVSGAPSGAVTLQPLALRSPGTLPPPPPQLQSKDNQTNQDYHHQHQQQQQEVVRFVDATSPVTVVSLLLKHSSSCPPSFSNNSNSDNNSQNYDDAIDPASSSSLSSHISSSATDPAIANTSSSSSSTTTSSSSIFRGLYVAAGCEDGTVGVWDTDHLPLTSPSLPSSSTEGPGLGLGKGDRSCLFCHQLRPTERPVVCLEWLRMQGGSAATAAYAPSSSSYAAHEGGVDKSRTTTSNTSGTGGGTGSCVVLVTGASDGAIHVVDVNRGGTVLAVFDCGAGTPASSSADNGDVSSSSRLAGGGNGFHGTTDSNKAPVLLSMAVSDVLTASHDLALVPDTATASIFAGFSDGTVHVLAVHFGMNTTDCDHYEGVWKLAYVRLQPVCVVVASASGLTLLSSTPFLPPVHRGTGVKKVLLPGVTALCWTQSQSVIDQMTVPAAATLAVLTRHSDDDTEVEVDDTNATNMHHPVYQNDDHDHPTDVLRSCHGTLISGHADGTVKSWEVTIFHRIEP